PRRGRRSRRAQVALAYRAVHRIGAQLDGCFRLAALRARLGGSPDLLTRGSLAGGHAHGRAGLLRPTSGAPAPDRPTLAIKAHRPEVAVAKGGSSPGQSNSSPRERR